jgi:hypothetical protein
MSGLIELLGDVVHPPSAFRRDIPIVNQVLHVSREALVGFRPLRDAESHEQLPAEEHGSRIGRNVQALMCLSIEGVDILRQEANLGSSIGSDCFDVFMILGVCGMLTGRTHKNVEPNILGIVPIFWCDKVSTVPAWIRRTRYLG